MTCSLALLAIFASNVESNQRRAPSNLTPSTHLSAHLADAIADPATPEAHPTAINRTQPLNPTTTPARTFDAWVDHLVTLGLRTVEAVENAELSLARELDETARFELKDLQRVIEASDEKALHALCGMLSEDESLEAQVRRRVLNTILEVGLHDRWRRFEFGASRDSADHLVTAMLAAVHQEEILATTIGMSMLVGRPFLGLAHENSVLAIVEATTEFKFLSDVARALLTTLWDNLEASGARGSSQLASLALMFIDDANSSRRLAALEHLLTAPDGRFQDFVIEHAQRTRDLGLIDHLASKAATSLEPARALDVLSRLGTVENVVLTGAYMTLGERSGDFMSRVYEQKLGDNISPKVRAELITGAGFRGDAIELAQLAFELDPDREVRSRALFVIAASSAPVIAERTLAEALDDPTFADDSFSVGTIVSALGNLGSQGAVNAVHRIGRRLLPHPRLSDFDRKRLNEILSNYVPSPTGG